MQNSVRKCQVDTGAGCFCNGRTPRSVCPSDTTLGALAQTWDQKQPGSQNPLWRWLGSSKELSVQPWRPWSTACLPGYQSGVLGPELEAGHELGWGGSRALIAPGVSQALCLSYGVLGCGIKPTVLMVQGVSKGPCPALAVTLGPHMVGSCLSHSLLEPKSPARWAVL